MTAIASSSLDNRAMTAIVVPGLGHAVAVVRTAESRAPSYRWLRGSTNVGQYANKPVEPDHERLKARLRPTRGLRRDRNARVMVAGHAFVENVRRSRNDFAIGAAHKHRLAGAFGEFAMAIGSGFREGRDGPARLGPGRPSRAGQPDRS
jgi:hypothetical protein